MSVLCLTGWQQDADALACIAPDARHFDYTEYTNAEAAMAALPNEAVTLAIGWSLGAQLLVRALAGGFLRAQTALLLAPAWQFIADEHFGQGMSKEMFAEVRGNYVRDPRGMSAQFAGVIALGDAHAASIARTLQKAKVWKQGLFWLDELAKFSCRTLEFAGFPETLLVHGEGDKVTNIAAADAFAKHLPRVRVEKWKDCGHAPQLHDGEALRAIIRAHV